jgi:SRSO17 transposase
MIIRGIPKFVRPLCRGFRQNLSGTQWSYLRTIVLALLLTTRKAKLVHLAAIMPSNRHRTSYGVFLHRSDWDPVPLLAGQALQMLRSMKPRRGEVVYLLLDDTRIVKRGKKMEGVCKLWDHAHQCFDYGHTVVTAAILFRGVVLPWRLELWEAEKSAGRRFRKLTHIAADLIREFVPPQAVKVRVLFDAFYLCPAVVRTCESRGFTWFSVAAKGRNFTRSNGKKRRIKGWAPGVLRYQGRWVRLRRSRGWRWMRIAAMDGKLSKIGPVRMVLCKRHRNAWKTTVAVVTNETKQEARTILAVYEKRWNIEVLFKELRGSLGLGDYQVMSRHAIVRHLHLCALAHLMLTHHSLTAVGAKAKAAHTELSLPPMNERLEALRDAVRHDQIDHLLRRIKQRNLRKRVKEYLLAA